MSELRKLTHGVNNDIYNILSLLKYIKEEVVIESSDISSMLDGVLDREQSLLDKVKKLNELKD